MLLSQTDVTEDLDRQEVVQLISKAIKDLIALVSLILALILLCLFPEDFTFLIGEFKCLVGIFERIVVV